MKRNIAIIISLLAIVGLSCKRSSKDADFFGSEYKPAPKDFKVISYARNISTLLYDFSKTPTAIRKEREFFVNAKFSAKVNWTFKVKGRISGAERTFKGTGDTINNSILYWRGGVDGPRFFISNEMCDLSLSFLGSEIVVKDSIKLFGLRPISSTINGVKSILVDDFDGNTLTPFGNAYADRADGDVFSYNTTYPFLSVQGSQSYWWKSIDKSNNTYCGGADTDPVSTSINTVNQAITDSVASNVYVNCYVFGSGKVGSAISFLIYEMDQSSGTFVVDKFNDRWIYTLPINWIGWKLVSIPYSSFTKPSSLGCLGNCKLEPTKTKGFALSFDSYPDAGKEVEGAIDLFVVSQGGPFNPEFQ